jgi:hypothetical protein
LVTIASILLAREPLAIANGNEGRPSNWWE